MSQEQRQRPQSDDYRYPQQEPIKYGDVFTVSGELASKPIAPQDAVSMQAAENRVFGQTQRGGPAAVMQSAAAINQKAGLLSADAASGVTQEAGGIHVSESIVSGNRVVTESIGGQVVGQYMEPDVPTTTPGMLAGDPVTIGEALESAALSAGDKPIDQSDASAINAAETRVTEDHKVTPAGVAASAQSAANLNPRTARYEDKTTLIDVLHDASERLPSDKPVTREDAERIMSAELRNKPDMTTTPGGVADSMAAAARLNQRRS